MARIAGLAMALLVALGTSSAAAVSVKRGAHYGARIFPDNAFTVRDKAQLTGLRVRFRRGLDYPTVGGRVRKDCTSGTYSICDSFRELNRLDGFDLQPRVTVPFTGGVKLASVNDKNFFITTARGKFASGLRQLTFDPATRTLAGISDKFLKEGTRYRIHVTNGIRDGKGKRVKACRGACVVGFTTRTASGELVRIRKALDAAQPSKLEFKQNGVDDVFRASLVAPSVSGPVNGMVRDDQVKADPKAPGAFKSSAVPNLIPPGQAGYFAFGSFLSPRSQFASASGHQDSATGRTDGEIPPVPTTKTPKPLGADRLTAIVVTPDPAQFPPPWPAAVYGPGFTRSAYDIFVSADYNASRGILTVATDPSGHGYGSQSKTTGTPAGAPPTFPHYRPGRADDLPPLRPRARPRRRRHDRHRAERRRRADRARTGGRRRGAALAQADRRAPVGARADGRRQHGARPCAEGGARHPDRRHEPRRRVADHVLRHQLRRHLRHDADGHRPALPPRPDERAGRPDHGHRAAVELPRRPGGNTQAHPAQHAERRSRPERVHRGHAASKRAADGDQAPRRGLLARVILGRQLVRAHGQPGDVRAAHPVATGPRLGVEA